jgi:hypothetical protein
MVAEEAWKGLGIPDVPVRFRAEISSTRSVGSATVAERGISGPVPFL